MPQPAVFAQRPTTIEKKTYKNKREHTFFILALIQQP